MPMDSALQRLQSRFTAAQAAGEPLVLATTIATRGSTYRKAGAQILIGRDKAVEGLISGGCLEADIAERAVSVFETGVPKLISYDHGGDGKAPWGLELGCEGSMDILLMRLDPSHGWEPLRTLMAHLADRQPPTWGMVLESELAALPVGTSTWSGDPRLPAGTPADAEAWIAGQLALRREDAGIVECAQPRIRLFVATPPQLHDVLVVGGGPDAQPLVEFGATMGWRITLVDHRPAYSRPESWPRAHRVLTLRPPGHVGQIDLARFDAAVIMSHHLPTDLAWLAVLAPEAIPYVGLLGPESRRRQLLADLGDDARRLQGRLRAPIGLQIGGRDPQSIALAIAAELQAFFHGRA